MLKKLRRWLVKTPVMVAVGLVLAYLLFGWFGFEPLVKWAGPKFIADKTGHSLTLAAAKFDPLALSVDLKGVKLAEPDGKPLLAFDQLFVDFEASSLFRWAYAFADIRLTGPTARVELRPDGSLNWLAFIQAFADKEDKPDKPLPRLLIRRFSMEKGRVDFADHKVTGGFDASMNPLDLTLSDLSTLFEDKGAYSVAATTQAGARIRWKGSLGLNPILANGDLAIDQVSLERFWPYMKGKLNMAPPQGVAALSLAYRAGYADKQLSLLVDKLGMSLEKLALKSKGAAEPALALDKLALTGGRFDLAKQELDLGEITLNGGKVRVLRDRAGRLAIQDWFAPPTSAAIVEPAPTPVPGKTSAAPQSTAGQPWRVKLDHFGLNNVALRLVDEGFAQPLVAEVGNVKVDFAARAEGGGAKPLAMVEGLSVDVSGLCVQSGLNKPWFVLGGATLADGRIDLAARQANVAHVTLSNGKLDALRDARGRIALAQAFQPAPGKPVTSAKPVASAKGGASADAAWHYQIDEVALAGFQVDLRDASVQPAAALTLTRIEASVRNVSENLKTALPVKLDFRVKQGGAFHAAGKVIPAKPAADFRLKLTGLALAPAQPYLAQAANLTLASGRASGQGRVRYDGKLKFQGGFDVADLLLNETDGGARFLAWKRLFSDSVSYSPKGLDIEEIRLDSLGAKLVIDKGKTVNLKKILKSAPPAAGGGEAGVTAGLSKPGSLAKGKGTALTPSPSPDGGGEKAFPVTIERIRIEHGEMDFADYSLALPFGTRIHDFKGAFSGISTRPGSVAQLELDGKVDEYGLARAVGQLDLFNPTGFMDIKVVFRNVEMTNLTPYSATFAGRKIASGKLSLDLEYKIKARQLLGENRIVMDQLTLGERVQSPTAKDLPLDLALAILKDSDGKIDLGLPVSGSLDDPQFSYGQIIWKAITNIIGKIVTAPFRALGALFGGGGEKLEQILFEAGEAGLTPPEMEKFKKISQILAKRPGLSLSVKGAWSAEIDRPVMKEARLRRAVAEKMDIKLAPDEEPGPVSSANPKHQAALEALYEARFGEAEWNTLRAKWRQANPDKKAESGAGKLMSRLTGLFKKEEPLSADDLARLKDVDLHVLIYGRLLEKETVSDEALQALARHRTQAVVAALAAAGAPKERVVAAGIERYEGDARDVPVKLELGVAK